MKTVLITGMSGTGKSTVIRELAARGFSAIDTSWNPEWEQPPPDGSGPGWIWREERIEALLSEKHTGALFLAACVENQGKFYAHFDQIVLLSASAELTRERLFTRTTNPYGKRPEEIALVLRFKETVEPLLRRSATIEIDTAFHSMRSWRYLSAWRPSRVMKKRHFSRLSAGGVKNQLSFGLIETVKSGQRRCERSAARFI